MRNNCNNYFLLFNLKLNVHEIQYYKTQNENSSFLFISLTHKSSENEQSNMKSRLNIDCKIIY